MEKSNSRHPAQSRHQDTHGVSRCSPNPLRKRDLRIGADVLDALPDTIVVVDFNQNIVQVNETVTSMFGWAADDLIGCHINVLIPERFRELHTKHVARFANSDARALEMSARSTLLGLKRDGSEFHAEGTILKSRADDLEYLVVILRDVSDRIKSEQKLKIALDEAKASVRVKSDVLATMSHELKTPLNAIIGFSELIEQGIFGPLGDSRYHDYISNIHHSGKHLLDVINSILEAARMDSGRLALRQNWFSLNQTLKNIARRIEPVLRKKNQTVDIWVDEKLDIFADSLLAQQVFFNLISNASKFSPSGALIRMETHALKGRLAIDVVDSGIGIPAKSVSKLGDPFVQAHTGTARASDGVGLGLYIVRSYLELHQAALSISSIEGYGTTIRTCWPACRVRSGDSPSVREETMSRACRTCFTQHPQQHCSKAAIDPASGSIKWLQGAD